MGEAASSIEQSRVSATSSRPKSFERNQRLVFNNQHVGANLIRDFLTSHMNERGRFFDRAIESISHGSRPKSFERAEKKRNARLQGYRVKIAPGTDFIAGNGRLVNISIDQYQFHTFRKYR